MKSRHKTANFGQKQLTLFVATLVCAILPLAACSSNTSGPQMGADVLQSLQVSAEVEELDGGSPATYEIRTVLTNTGKRAIRFQTFRRCPVRLSAYDGPARSGQPAWDEASGIACSYVAMTIELEPGESRTFVRQLKAANIALHRGTYYLSAALVVEDSVKIVDAGTLVLK